MASWYEISFTGRRSTVATEFGVITIAGLSVVAGLILGFGEPERVVLTSRVGPSVLVITGGELGTETDDRMVIPLETAIGVPVNVDGDVTGACC